jgi:hypothetical protein
MGFRLHLYRISNVFIRFRLDLDYIYIGFHVLSCDLDKI